MGLCNRLLSPSGYRLANLAVHAMPRAGYFDLGLPPGLEVIPARPSHFGLAEPGGHSMYSLMLATVTFIAHVLPTYESDSELAHSIITLGKMKLVTHLATVADGLFVEIQNQLDDDEPQLMDPPEIFERGT